MIDLIHSNLLQMTDSPYFFANHHEKCVEICAQDRFDALFRKLRYEKIELNQEVFTPRVLSEKSLIPEIGSSDLGLLIFVLQAHEKFARYNIVEA